MIFLKRLWWLLLLGNPEVVVPGNNPSPPQAVRLVGGSLTLLVLPQQGGRISSLKQDGVEQLFTANQDSVLFGSTVWTSPQSVWRWPPYPALDSGPYTLLEQTTQRVMLQSAVCPQSGYQLTKTITVLDPDSAIGLTYTLQNRTDSSRTLALWEVTRRPKTGVCLFAPGEFMPGQYRTPNPAYKNAFYLTRQPAGAFPGLTVTDSLVQLRVESGANRVPKLFSDSRGWLAHVAHDRLFVKVFADAPVADLPPFQGEVEVFTAPGKDYIELEAHSPYRRLGPGQLLTWRVRWYVRPLHQTGPAAVSEATQLVHRLICQFP